MNITLRILISAMMLGMASTASRAHADNTADTFRTQVLPVLQARCIKCHGPERQESKINLSGMRSLEQLTGDEHLWFRVLDQLEFAQMPPEDEPQLTATERRTLVDWIRNDLTSSLAAKQRTLGRSGFRRLSRAEFSNTFEDLFGIRPDISLLPEDGRVDGYTKVSAALPMSMDGAYGYYELARSLLEDRVLRPLPNPEKNPRDARMARLPAMESGQSAGHTLELPDGWFVSFNTDDTSGRLRFTSNFNVSVPGTYKLRVHAYAYQSDKPLALGVYKGKTYSYPQEIELAAILEAPAGKPAVLETEIYLNRGERFRLIPFGIGVQVPKNQQASQCKGPGLALQWVDVESPEQPILADRWLTADFPEDLIEAMRRPRVYIKEKGSYRFDGMNADQFVALMRTTLARVGRGILRREVTDAELDEIDAAVRQGLADEQPLKTIFFDRVTDLLTSPEFFCVIESPGELSGYALASRLSYFLWNSTPDEELLELAAQGQLSDPAVLGKQTDRMLSDPKSDRFAQDFLNQWLDLHAINDTSPDNKLYPEYDDLLKFSSLEETAATFRRILRENRNVREFVDPSWLLVNARLAKHYGLGNIGGVELQSVNIPEGSPFGGLWTQPAVLKVTADGSSTSPVKRGVWISERLLGVPISPPPPNIEPINPDTRGATTLREQLARHSNEGSCASCHKKFDPYGFALESFDVMGQYRDHYRLLAEKQPRGKPMWTDGLPVDSSGITPEGKEFEDIVQLRELLGNQPEKLAWGVTQHLMTYATATPTGPLDAQAIQQIVDQAASDQYGLRSLVHGIVQSPLFRWK